MGVEAISWPAKKLVYRDAGTILSIRYGSVGFGPKWIRDVVNQTQPSGASRRHCTR